MAQLRSNQGIHETETHAWHITRDIVVALISKATYAPGALEVGEMFRTVYSAVEDTIQGDGGGDHK